MPQSSREESDDAGFGRDDLVDAAHGDALELDDRLAADGFLRQVEGDLLQDGEVQRRMSIWASMSSPKLCGRMRVASDVDFFPSPVLKTMTGPMTHRACFHGGKKLVTAS